MSVTAVTPSPPSPTGSPRPPRRPPGLRAIATACALALGLGTALASTACVGAPLPAERRASRKELEQRLRQFERPGVVIGEFALARDPVVDGDTIRVEGLGNTLRLLAVDAEETFKHESERRAYDKGWEHYVKAMRGTAPRPVKFATPVGDEGKEFGKHFFAGVQTIRLERDDPKEIRDYYNRYLAYVIVVKNGQELNYNVELVRAGLSPYFSKYGYSRRFHADFVAAEAEARAAKRGIWDPAKQHYPDYDERKRWWDGRAEFIKRFEAEARGKDNYLQLTSYDTPRRLEDLVGKKVVVMGSISEVRLGDKGPTKVLLARRQGSSFPLVFFDKDVFLSLELERYKGEYIRAEGFVSRYDDKMRGRVVLQLVIDTPGQVTLP